MGSGEKKKTLMIMQNRKTKIRDSIVERKTKNRKIKYF